MVSHGTALVPTLINIATFPDIAESASRFPIYAAHMRDLHSRVKDTIGAAHDAGIPIYAGTDAGGSIVHGRIADEVEELKAVGLTPSEALGAACWDARVARTSGSGSGCARGSAGIPERPAREQRRPRRARCRGAAGHRRQDPMTWFPPDGVRLAE